MSPNDFIRMWQCAWFFPKGIQAVNGIICAALNLVLLSVQIKIPSRLETDALPNFQNLGSSYMDIGNKYS